MADVKLKGDQRELYTKRNFTVHIQDGGGWSTGFQKCSELSAEIAKVEYFEGGSAIPWKIPGGVTMTDVTLERGISSSIKFYEWALQCIDFSTGGRVNTGSIGNSAGGSIVVPGLHKDVFITQLDRDLLASNAPQEWKLKNAWVTKFVAGDWDNTANEATIEMVTLTFDYFEIPA